MLNGNLVLLWVLPAFLTLFACFPIFCTPSPIGLSTNLPDKRLKLASPASSNNDASLPPRIMNNDLGETDVDGGNPWQELFWEEEQVRSKKEAGGDPNTKVVVEKKPSTTTPKPEEKVDANIIKAEYVCTEESDEGGCRSPLLKHYKMYTVDPEDDFYPGWTYHGFHC